MSIIRCSTVVIMTYLFDIDSVPKSTTIAADVVAESGRLISGAFRDTDNLIRVELCSLRALACNK